MKHTHLDFGCLRTENPISDGQMYILSRIQSYLETPSIWCSMTLTLFLILVITNMIIGYKYWNT